MPRQVDHAQRREEIVEALFRVSVREGLAAATFRTVAAEAGVSVNRVQYYFGSKAGLLAGALQELGRRTVARSLREISAAGPEPSARALLRAAIAGALPSDDEGRAQTLLFFSFYVAAMTDPDLASDAALGAPQWTAPFAASVIRTAQENGEVDTDRDAGHEAAILMSAFAGLALSIVAGTTSADAAMSAIDYQLDRIFGPETRA